jgi:hypothetical protein
MSAAKVLKLVGRIIYAMAGAANKIAAPSSFACGQRLV